MSPAEANSTFWTIIFVGPLNERSSMKVSMGRDKLDKFVQELKSKVIGQLAFWNEVGDRHQFQPVDLFAVAGHLYKESEVKNAKS